MKTIRLIFFFKIFIVLGFCLGPLIGNAQKLPNKQESGLRAPAAVKIDGDPVEWGNNFKAHNFATDIYYTMANDSLNLYLVIQAREKETCGKIIRGGITVTLNHTLVKKDDAPVKITFPTLQGAAQNEVANLFLNKINKSRDTGDLPTMVSDLNKTFADYSGNVKISRFAGLANNNKRTENGHGPGIKVAAQFNERLNYTCEFAVPLSDIYISSGVGNFSYNIRVNGPDETLVPATDTMAHPVRQYLSLPQLLPIFGASIDL